jgi:hypothetical protein
LALSAERETDEALMADFLLAHGPDEDEGDDEDDEGAYSALSAGRRSEGGDQ